MRNLKTFGLALVAVLAMSAVAASAASAEFTLGAGATKVTASQVGANFFYIEGGFVECTTAGGEGAAPASGSESLNFVPSYSGCNAFGLPADIKANNCNFELTTNGTVHVCEKGGAASGGPIEITVTSGGASVCTVTVAKQTPTTPVTIHNSGTSTTMDLLITATNITGIKYTVDGGGGKCGKVGAHADGEYEGDITITAEDNNKVHKDITHSTPTKKHP